MAGLQIEFDFTLPKGFVDDVGVLHRNGTMRLATALDEIESARSKALDGPDDPYLTILVLARVIKELGSIPTISTDIVESLFAADLAFLQDMYGIINFGDAADLSALQAMVVDDPIAPPDDHDPDAFPDDDLSTTVSTAAPSMRRRGHVEEVQRTSTL